MTGVISDKPFPTYPDGFPDRIINEFIKETGVLGVLGNCVASGTEIIKKLGAEHERTGKPIVYTSADSVFRLRSMLTAFRSTACTTCALKQERFSPDRMRWPE